MLKDAIQKNNKSSLLVYSLGQVYLEQGNLDEAINYLSQAISLDPNQAQFYCDRGFLYYSTAKLDLTKKDLQKAIDKGIEGKDDECVFKAQSMLQVLNKKP
jgi:tetratricopeptide (TPR) repeat protein